MINGFKDPTAQRAPMANNNESPGKKGAITKPVSQKTIIVRIP